MKPPFKIWMSGQMKNTAKNAAVKKKTSRANDCDIGGKCGQAA